MPLRTEYIDFENEIESLKEERDDVVERVAQMDDETPSQLAQRAVSEGNDLHSQINILQDLQNGRVEGLPEMEGVELGGLTDGEIALVEDIVEKYDGVRSRHPWVAIGTRSAPYLEHDPDAGDLTRADYEETTHRVSDLPSPYVDWAEEKISVLSHLSEEQGNGFLRLVQEKQAET